ncbi:hypothetical protein U0E16_33610, partial [Burkholderia pseudomallei]|nr:hypothetical protein [Burkholderia pseudomallei]
MDLRHRPVFVADAHRGIAEEERIGGTCVLRGCIPKKLPVYASHYSHDVEDAAGYGWTFDIGLFSWPTLIEASPRKSASAAPACCAAASRKSC